MEAFTNVFSLCVKDFTVLKISGRFIAFVLDKCLAFYVNQFFHLLLLVRFTTYLFDVNYWIISIKRCGIICRVRIKTKGQYVIWNVLKSISRIRSFSPYVRRRASVEFLYLSKSTFDLWKMLIIWCFITPKEANKYASFDICIQSLPYCIFTSKQVLHCIWQNISLINC